MFLVDLGVPRDIDPDAGKLRDIYLYTIDDLRKVADESLDKRQDAARQAVGTIEREVREYLRWLHGARAAEGLRQLRTHAEEQAAALAERAIHQVEAGGDAAAAIRQLSSTLTHRILHGPSTRLRRAAEEQHDDILRAADWLFEAGEDALEAVETGLGTPGESGNPPDPEELGETREARPARSAADGRSS
jgi:glutamyl-tRNA reductase